MNSKKTHTNAAGISWTAVPLWGVLLIFPCDLAAAPSLANPTITPTAVTVQTSVKAMVTVRIVEHTVIPTSVNLLRIKDAAAASIIGQLNDSAINGDAVAGDGIFSALVTINEQQAGVLTFQVSAAFSGILGRVLSKPIKVFVLPTSRQLSVPTVGASLFVPVGWNVYLNDAQPDEELPDSTTLSLLLLSPAGSEFEVLPRGGGGFDGGGLEVGTTASDVTVSGLPSWRREVRASGELTMITVGITRVPGLPNYRVEFVLKNSTDLTIFEDILQSITIP